MGLLSLPTALTARSSCSSVMVGESFSAAGGAAFAVSGEHSPARLRRMNEAAVRNAIGRSGVVSLSERRCMFFSSSVSKGTMCSRLRKLRRVASSRASVPSSEELECVTRCHSSLMKRTYAASSTQSVHMSAISKNDMTYESKSSPSPPAGAVRAALARPSACSTFFSDLLSLRRACSARDLARSLRQSSSHASRHSASPRLGASAWVMSRCTISYWSCETRPLGGSFSVSQNWRHAVAMAPELRRRSLRSTMCGRSNLALPCM
mmetsp:Transcript_47601/g.117851  ORF Transcript_47601/g.117851 Transcript_47601/m.117851 type:complete len:264 (-) Transcript_47601:465-1256(-)